jgi:Protein of unknown function (DUF4232)
MPSLTNYRQRRYDQFGILRDMSTAHLNRSCLLSLSLALSTLTGHALTLSDMEAPQAVVQEAAQAPLCNADSIDTTFTFASLPAGQQTVSLHFRNKSNAACRLQGWLGPSFAVDSHSMNVETCWLCDENNAPSPAPERHSGNQILLAPGERATLDLHWASTGESCQWADWVALYFQWTKQAVYLFIPSNWPMHICSAVKSAGYRAEANSPAIREVSGGVLRVSVLQPVIYSDERATLHAEVRGQASFGAPPYGCASLYSVRQDPSVAARLDPLVTIGFSSRPSYTSEQIKEDDERAWPSWKTDRLRRCDMPAGATVADADITAADLANVTHVEWRTAPAPGEDPVFLMATTHFTVLDADTLAPNWGDPVKGIRAGLSVDRASFSLSERVPLHLRWENVNAALPLAQGECMEPEPSLEIQDAKHHVLGTFPTIPMCNGHGWGPFTIPKGKAQRMFNELAGLHPAPPIFFSEVLFDLPGPGVYYLVSVWSPNVLEALDADAGKTPYIRAAGRVGKVYGTARSLPVRVEFTAATNR